MQFQREPRSGKGYPHFAHWPDLDCDGNVYVSGYGLFTLTRRTSNARKFGEAHRLRRNYADAAASAVAFIYSRAAICRMAGKMAAAGNTTATGAVERNSGTDAYRHLDIRQLPDTYFLSAGNRGREIRQRSNTAFPPVTAILAILCSLGLSGMTVFVRDFLNGVLQAVNLVEVNTSSPPVLPIAQMMYLMRTAVFA